MTSFSLRRSWPLAALAALSACAPAAAPHAGPRAAPAPVAVEAALDSILRAAYPADQPGATAIVVRDGQVLYRGARGMAEMELGMPLRPEMVFRIGSVTKQFTGAAILMLAEEGKLSLSDPLTRFFPDYPVGGRTVTVEHLLGHTSGIRSYTDMPGWPPTWRTDLTLDELIAVFRDEPFDFEPGERWSYNNSAYVLLGAIIERASGMPYADFVRTRIFDPLGMASSRYDEAAAIIPGRIPGYSRGGDGEWTNAEFLSMTHPHAAGALLSSVDDLARWNAAIERGELLSPLSWRRAFTPIALNDGTSTRYGAGWIMGRLGRMETVEHDGGIHGFVSSVVRVPEARLFVAVLANADQPVASPGAVALALAARALGVDAEVPEVPVPAARLDDYVGVYRISEEATRTITREGDRLFSQRGSGTRFELRPIGEDLFAFPETGSWLRFERVDGRVVAMEFTPRAGPGDRAPRTDEAPAPTVEVPDAVLARYAGVYRLAPNFDITVTHEPGGRLYAQATGQPRMTLRAVSPTRFQLVEVDAALEFHEADGEVVRVVLFQAGREMPAPRVP